MSIIFTVRDLTLKDLPVLAEDITAKILNGSWKSFLPVLYCNCNVNVKERKIEKKLGLPLKQLKFFAKNTLLTPKPTEIP